MYFWAMVCRFGGFCEPQKEVGFSGGWEMGVRGEVRRPGVQLDSLGYSG